METKANKTRPAKWFEVQVARNVLATWLSAPCEAGRGDRKLKEKALAKKYGKSAWCFYRVAYRLDSDGNSLVLADDFLPAYFLTGTVSGWARDESPWFSEDDRKLFAAYSRARHRLSRTDAVVLRVGIGFGDFSMERGSINSRSKERFVTSESVPALRQLPDQLASTKLYELLTERFWNTHVFLDSKSKDKEAWERSLFEVDELLAYLLFGEIWSFCLTRQASAPFRQGKYVWALSEMSDLVRHLLQLEINRLTDQQLKEYKQYFVSTICPPHRDCTKPSNLPRRWQGIWSFDRKQFHQELLAGGADTLNQLNAFFKESPADALTDFLRAFFDSITGELSARKLLTPCGDCGSFLVLLGRPTKRFCSPQSEGRNCGKRARNKAFYAAHPELKEVQRKKVKLLRDFYKGFGIKK
jgi:hypothetical protein